MARILLISSVLSMLDKAMAFLSFSVVSCWGSEDLAFIMSVIAGAAAGCVLGISSIIFLYKASASKSSSLQGSSGQGGCWGSAGCCCWALLGVGAASLTVFSSRDWRRATAFSFISRMMASIF